MTSNITPAYYSWTATAAPTITGVVTPGTGDKIIQQLYNTAISIDNVTYKVTPMMYTSTNVACVGVPLSTSVMVRLPEIPELGLDRGGLCVGDSVVIDAGNFPSGNYNWSVNDSLVVGEAKSKKTFVVPLGSYKISVAYVNACGKLFKDSVQYTSKQKIDISFDKGDTCFGLTTSFVPIQLSTQENVNQWSWKIKGTNDSLITTGLNPTANYIFQSMGKQEVHLMAYSDGCKVGDTTRTMEIKNCAIDPMNIFTPNGDGKNDDWTIKGIQDFPNAEIVIFNRWGVIVHHVPGTALIPWDGTNDKGELLEQGTYYYVITLNKVQGSNQIVKGYVTIIRSLNE